MVVVSLPGDGVGFQFVVFSNTASVNVVWKYVEFDRTKPVVCRTRTPTNPTDAPAPRGLRRLPLRPNPATATARACCRGQSHRAG